MTTDQGPTQFRPPLKEVREPAETSEALSPALTEDPNKLDQEIGPPLGWGAIAYPDQGATEFPREQGAAANPCGETCDPARQRAHRFLERGAITFPDQGANPSEEQGAIASLEQEMKPHTEPGVDDSPGSEESPPPQQGEMAQLDQEASPSSGREATAPPGEMAGRGTNPFLEIGGAITSVGESPLATAGPLRQGR